MTANRNEIHHNWKQRPKNQHQKTKPPIQSNQQNMRYIELRENLMKQVENKKSNFEETPPEILSVGWCRPSSTAPIAKTEAAQRRPSKPTFQKTIFFFFLLFCWPQKLFDPIMQLQTERAEIIRQKEKSIVVSRRRRWGWRWLKRHKAKWLWEIS